jgi:superfamily I DNA/RNA helicase
VEFYEKADRSKSLGLSDPGVKLVTIHSAKGAGWQLTLSAVVDRASGLLSCIQEP